MRRELVEDDRIFVPAGLHPVNEHLLGRPGRSIRTYITDHAERWTRRSRSA